MPQIVRDGVVSAGALLLLLLLLVLFDGRVRDQAVRVTTNLSTPSGVAATSGQVYRWTSVLADVARDQSIDRGPLVVFVAAASVLVFFMLRT